VHEVAVASKLPPFGLAPLTVLDLAPEAMLAVAHVIGYRAIGLRLFPAYPGSPAYPVPVGSTLMRELRAGLAHTGVKVFDVEFILVDPNFALDAFKAGIESAAHLGAQRINVAGDDDDTTRLADNLRKLADFAGSHGLAVDIEPMRWRKVNSFPRALDVIAAVGRPNVGLLTDCLHLDRTGYTAAELALTKPSVRRALQLCDASATRPKTMDGLLAEARNGRLLPGDGALPLFDILDAMPADVALSIECPLASHIPADERAQRCFDATVALLQRYQKRATP
jgi:sugar phosphate isomerase/epimerase